MKKIFSLVAMIALCATATWAITSGPFVHSYSTGVYWDAETPNVITLRNATLDFLEINPTSTYGKDYYIYVEGDCKIEPSSKLEPIYFNKTTADTKNTSYQLYIQGSLESENRPTLVLTSQRNAAIYFRGYNSSDDLYIYMSDIELTCNAKLQDAKYGIASYFSNKLDLQFNRGLKLTLDGKTAPWNNISNIIATGMQILEPAGAELNSSYGNNFIKLNGETYNGKVTIVTPVGVTLNSVEQTTDITPLNQSNVTGDGISGTVSYDNGVLTLNNATFNSLHVDENARLKEIRLIGRNVINYEMYFGGFNDIANEVVIKSDGTGSLTVNSYIEVNTIMTLTIDNAKVENYSSDFGTLKKAWYKSDGMNLEVKNGGSYYGEAPSFGALKYIYDSNTYEKTEGTTESGLKTLYIRQIEDYYIHVWADINGESVYVKLTNETAADAFGDGTVSYNAATKVLTLNNANLRRLSINSGYTNRFTPIEQIYLVGKNTIINSFEVAPLDVSTLANGQLTITGPGSIDIVSQNNIYPTIYLLQTGMALNIVNTNVNLSAARYAIYTINSDVVVNIDNANVTLQSGDAGVVKGLAGFNVENAEYVAPANVSFFENQLCSNYQPIAANTKVEIRGNSTGVEYIVANDSYRSEARKVMIDGVIYILKGEKMYNVLGAEVK